MATLTDTDLRAILDGVAEHLKPLYQRLAAVEARLEAVEGERGIESDGRRDRGCHCPLCQSSPQGH